MRFFPLSLKVCAVVRYPMLTARASFTLVPAGGPSCKPRGSPLCRGQPRTYCGLQQDRRRRGPISAAELSFRVRFQLVGRIKSTHASLLVLLDTLESLFKLRRQ